MRDGITSVIDFELFIDKVPDRHDGYRSRNCDPVYQGKQDRGSVVLDDVYESTQHEAACDDYVMDDAR